MIERIIYYAENFDKEYKSFIILIKRKKISVQIIMNCTNYGKKYMIYQSIYIMKCQS